MRVTRSLFLVVLGAGFACGGDSTAPPVPSAMVAAGGAAQSGLPGVTLALPLRVMLTGAAGAPFQGGRVTFNVTAGSAALGSPVDTSDASGEASTTVTVGVIPGNINVRATVTGVAPVDFALTALNPCLVPVDVTTSTTVNGVLTTFDCQFPTSFFTDFYRFVVPSQAGLQISMDAVFDTYLEQYFDNDAFIAVNDDLDSIPTNTDSRINVIAAAGTYKVGASSFLGNVTGAYAWTIGPRSQALTGCRGDPYLTWITRGVALTDSVEATDCITTRTGNGRAFGDRVFITLTTLRNLSVTMASAAFNPRIELYELVQPAGQPATLVFRTAVDGTTGSPATLTHTPPAGALFRLEFTSVDTVVTGAYTVTVAGPTPAVNEVIALPNVSLPVERPRAAPGKARRN